MGIRSSLTKGINNKLLRGNDTDYIAATGGVDKTNILMTFSGLNLNLKFNLAANVNSTIIINWGDAAATQTIHSVGLSSQSCSYTYSDNEISHDIEILGNVENLKLFECSQNLGSNGLSALDIRNASNLQYLFLANQQLESEILFNYNLELLEIKLDNIFESTIYLNTNSFSNNLKLEKLELINLNLSTNYNLPNNITHLNLSDNDYSNISTLALPTNLTNLYISNNPSLNSTINISTTNLKVLDLNNTNLNDANFQLLYNDILNLGSVVNGYLNFENTSNKLYVSQRDELQLNGWTTIIGTIEADPVNDNFIEFQVGDCGNITIEIEIDSPIISLFSQSIDWGDGNHSPISAWSTGVNTISKTYTPNFYGVIKLYSNEFGKYTGITINNSNLNGFNDRNKIPNITNINFSNNVLNNINLTNLNNLTNLDLSVNSNVSITYISITHVPVNIHNLNISQTPISQIGNLASLTSLANLNISYTLIDTESVDDILLNMYPNITTLNITNLYSNVYPTLKFIKTIGKTLILNESFLIKDNYIKITTSALSNIKIVDVLNVGVILENDSINNGHLIENDVLNTFVPNNSFTELYIYDNSNITELDIRCDNSEISNIEFYGDIKNNITNLTLHTNNVLTNSSAGDVLSSILVNLHNTLLNLILDNDNITNFELPLYSKITDLILNCNSLNTMPFTKTLKNINIENTIITKQEINILINKLKTSGVFEGHLIYNPSITNCFYKPLSTNILSSIEWTTSPDFNDTINQDEVPIIELYNNNNIFNDETSPTTSNMNCILFSSAITTFSFEIFWCTGEYELYENQSISTFDDGGDMIYYYYLPTKTNLIYNSISQVVILSNQNDITGFKCTTNLFDITFTYTLLPNLNYLRLMCTKPMDTFIVPEQIKFLKLNSVNYADISFEEFNITSPATTIKSFEEFSGINLNIGEFNWYKLLRMCTLSVSSDVDGLEYFAISNKTNDIPPVTIPLVDANSVIKCNALNDIGNEVDNGHGNWITWDDPTPGAEPDEYETPPLIEISFDSVPPIPPTVTLSGAGEYLLNVGNVYITKNNVGDTNPNNIINSTDLIEIQGLNGDILSTSNLNDITGLDLSNSTINNITGLDNLSNITELNVSDNNLTNIHVDCLTDNCNLCISGNVMNNTQIENIITNLIALGDMNNSTLDWSDTDPNWASNSTLSADIVILEDGSHNWNCIPGSVDFD